MKRIISGILVMILILSCVLDHDCLVSASAQGYDAFAKTGSGSASQSYIYYDANGGDGAPGAQAFVPGSKVTISSVKPSKGEDYRFVGWTDEYGSDVVKYDSGKIYKLDAGTDVTLYAVWRFLKTTYTITYYPGAEPPVRQKVKGGYAYWKLSYKPIREGYTFLGWSLYPDSNFITYYDGDVYPANSDLDLYAVWQEDEVQDISCINIYYDANGGDGAPDLETFESGSEVYISTTKPSKEGFYRFLGWTDVYGSNTVKYEPGGSYKFGTQTNVTLYAVWEKTNYTITYYPNGENGEYTTQVITGNYTTLVYKPTRKGYTFLGWSLYPNSSAVAYVYGDQYSYNRDLSLYAVWYKNANETTETTETETTETTETETTEETVTKTKVTIRGKSKHEWQYKYNKKYNLKCTSSCAMVLSYKSSNEKVVAVTGSGKAIIKGCGTAVITVTSPETAVYNKAVKKIIVRIKPEKLKGFSVTSDYSGQVLVTWKDRRKNAKVIIQASRSKKFKEGPNLKVIDPKSIKKGKCRCGGVTSGKIYYIVTLLPGTNACAPGAPFPPFAS